MATPLLLGSYFCAAPIRRDPQSKSFGMSLVFRLLKRSTGLFGHAAILAFLLISAGAYAQVDQAVYDQGEKLFKANCGSCHKPDKDMTGPAVVSATARWEGRVMHEWVKNSQAYIKSGNAHAKQVFDDHNKIVMPPSGDQ